MSIGEHFRTTVLDPTENEGMVDMRDGGNVPGITGQRARFERVGVIEKIDYHLYDLMGKRIGTLDGWRARGLGMVQYAVDLGLGSVPDYAREKVQPYGTSRKRC